MASIPEMHVGEEEGGMFIAEFDCLLLKPLFAQAFVNRLRTATHESHTPA